jgi:predicted AAA+ superfamily ATPase
MVTWYDIVEPHQDIKDGNFDEAVFAADLGNVALGNAPIDYNEPAQFFKKTYFTDGITNLLSMVHSKLETGKGSSVVEIKTPFGGGKTHALISIYHYLKNGAKVQSQLPNGLPPITAKVAVIVGTHLNPLEGNRRNGLTVQTLWGEIAYQLAGEAGYKEFEQNDTDRIAPGKEKLRLFLESCEPFILLFDEVLEYITKARGVEYHGTNLGSQTFAFLQELSETVSSLRRGMLIVTLPSSYLEDYTERKEESLAKLEKTFGRIESIEETVKGEEIYSIIQRRLFTNIKDPEMLDSIIMNYFELYQKNKDELPAKARDRDYKRKMELAYPFHPEVIDILYEKWGTFSSFQRTRGVLRLLANVIEDLYNKEKNIDMILPSDIGLEAAAVRLEFLHHIGNEYESIIGSDISGHEAKSMGLDKENKGWKHLAERIASTIFFYSFSGDKSEKGATLEYIKFATMHVDTIPSMVTEVLQRLDKSLWYLNEKGGMYRFSKIPNLNRMILDKKELYNIMYRDEMREILDNEVGTAFCSVLWPEKSEDIADNKELKLVILRPNENDDTPGEWLEKRGNTFRTYKNTIIFAKANPGGFGTFKDELKTYLALKEIEDEIKANVEDGLKDKAAEVAQRIKRIRDDFSFNARRMYNVILIGQEEIALGQPTVGRESLSNWYKMELESREKLALHLHYRYLMNKFMDGRDRIETKVIFDQFYKDMSLVIPESPDVIRRAIQQGVAEGAFGLAYLTGGEVDRDTLKFKSNVPTSSVSLAEEEVLVSKDRAAKIVVEREMVKVPKIEDTGGDDTWGEDTGGEGTGGEGTSGEDTGSGDTGPKRYKKISIRIEGIPSTKIADLSRGVLMPLSREVGGFEFTMEIDIDKAEGVSESTIKDKVKETISQIGARVTKEEME